MDNIEQIADALKKDIQPIKLRGPSSSKVGPA